MGADGFVDVPAVHEAQQDPGGFLRLFRRAVAAAHQQDRALLGFRDGLFLPQMSGAVVGLQPAANIQKLAGQLREVDRGRNQDIVARLDIGVNLLHFVLNGAAAVGPAEPAVHTGGNIRPVGVHLLVFPGQVLREEAEKAGGVAAGPGRAVQNKRFHDRTSCCLIRIV